jgi:glycerol-3-phosphate dehydrogenase
LLHKTVSLCRRACGAAEILAQQRRPVGAAGHGHKSFFTNFFTHVFVLAGVHVTLPDYYSPNAVGMIVPKTRDGRVVFMLPWEGSTIAGTTDAPAEKSMAPRAAEADVAFILNAIEDYLGVAARVCCLFRCFVPASALTAHAAS